MIETKTKIFSSIQFGMIVVTMLLIVTLYWLDAVSGGGATN
jgi:hypothetical protein